MQMFLCRLVTVLSVSCSSAMAVHLDALQDQALLYRPWPGAQQRVISTYIVDSPLDQPIPKDLKVTTTVVHTYNKAGYLESYSRQFEDDPPNTQTFEWTFNTDGTVMVKTFLVDHTFYRGLLYKMEGNLITSMRLYDETEMPFLIIDLLKNTSSEVTYHALARKPHNRKSEWTEETSVCKKNATGFLLSCKHSFTGSDIVADDQWTYDAFNNITESRMNGRFRGFDYGRDANNNIITVVEKTPSHLKYLTTVDSVSWPE